MKNNKISIKVGQINNSLKLKTRSLKRRSISRFQLLIIYIHKIIMINKNNKGRGEKIYGRRTSIDCEVKEALMARQDLAVGGKYGYLMPTWKPGFRISPASKLRKVAGMGVVRSRTPNRGIRSCDDINILKKVAGMGVMTGVAAVGVCAYGKARPCRKAGKNLIKFFAISIIAIVGLFVFLQGAEAAFSYNFL